MTLADQLEEKGRREGEARGKAEGKAETVLKLLMLKFGTLSETVQERVRGASIEELDRLTEKVLFATTVDELLQG